MKRKVFCSVFILTIALSVSLYSQNGNDIKSSPADTKIENNNQSSVTKTEEKNDGSFINSEKKNAESKTGLYDLFKKGGPFMWPILLFAAIALGFIVERYIFFLRSKLSPREFIEDLENTIMKNDLCEVETLCKKNNYIIGKILLKGLKLKELGIDRVEKSLAVAGSIQVATLERGLNVLSALGNITPMLGFLGTTSGMISAFADIAAADQVNAKVVASGIEEALLTTAAGLAVAIPTLFFYNYFIHKIDGFISDVERLSDPVIR